MSLRIKSQIHLMAFKVLRMSMSVSFTLPSHCRAPPVPSDLPPHNSIYESMEYSSFQSLPCKSHWPPHSFPTISQRLLCYVPLPGILSPHLSTVFFFPFLPCLLKYHFLSEACQMRLIENWTPTRLSILITLLIFLWNTYNLLTHTIEFAYYIYYVPCVLKMWTWR